MRGRSTVPARHGYTDGEAEIAHAAHESQPAQVNDVVVAVTATLARRLRQQSDRLLVTDHLSADAGLS